MRRETMTEVFEKIRRTAEIILEHQTSRAFKDKIVTLGAEGIIAMSKEAIDQMEKERKKETET